MKKCLFIILSTFFLGQNVQAQNVTTQCTCNPNGFNPFVVTLKGVTTTVRCGHQFSLTCNDTIKINSGYKCVGGCAGKFMAVLKNAVTNVVVQNYPPFTFPWNYAFTAAGNYKLEITPMCGTTKCTPCVFYFTVSCPTATCDCNVNGWQPFTATISIQAPMTVYCGHQFGVPKGKPFKLVGKYFCKGDCITKYSAVLKNNVTGDVVQNYPVFAFPWVYTLAEAGNYKLEITPICGSRKCQPCVFYFTMN
jgi:hypothetical protein